MSQADRAEFNNATFYTDFANRMAIMSTLYFAFQCFRVPGYHRFQPALGRSAAALVSVSTAARYAHANLEDKIYWEYFGAIPRQKLEAAIANEVSIKQATRVVLYLLLRSNRVFMLRTGRAKFGKFTSAERVK